MAKDIAWFNSFAAVLLMWMSHHQVFKLIRTTNNELILANGLLLLVVALVPFPTQTVGEFTGTEAQKMAILFYIGYSVLVSAIFVLFMQSAKSKNGILFYPEWRQIPFMTSAKDLGFGLFLNIIIFIITFFLPVAGLVLNFCMWIFWAAMAKDNKGETQL